MPEMNTLDTSSFLPSFSSKGDAERKFSAIFGDETRTELVKYILNSKEKNTYFNKIVRKFEKKSSRMTVHSKLAFLEKEGILTTELKLYDNNMRWIRNYTIAEENEPWIRAILGTD